MRRNFPLCFASRKEKMKKNTKKLEFTKEEEIKKDGEWYY